LEELGWGVNGCFSLISMPGGANVETVEFELLFCCDFSSCDPLFIKFLRPMAMDETLVGGLIADERFECVERVLILRDQVVGGFGV